MSVSLVIAALVLAALGCTVVKEDEATPTTGPQAVGGQQTGPAVELVMFTWTEASEESRNQELLARFEAANPGITVELQNSAGSGEAMAGLQTRIAAQEAPDVVSIHGAYFVPLASKGALLDLGSYVEGSGELSTDDFNQRMLRLCSVDGTLYSLPRYTSVYTLFYNRDMFDNAGLTYPDQQDPWDWDAFLAAAKKLTRDQDGDGRMDTYGVALDFWGARMYPWIWSAGGDIFSEDRKVCAIDSPEAIEGVKFAADLLLVHGVTPQTVSTDHNQGLDMFMQGNIGMHISGPWDVQGLEEAGEDQGLNWGVAPVPAYKKRATILGTENYAICKQSEHPEEAWKLLEFLMSTDSQVYMANELEKMPSRLSVLAGPYQEGEGREYRGVFADALEYAIDPPNVPDWAQIEPFYQEELDNIWIGKKSAAEGCKDAARRINEYRERQGS